MFSFDTLRELTSFTGQTPVSSSEEVSTNSGMVASNSEAVAKSNDKVPSSDTRMDGVETTTRQQTARILSVWFKLVDSRGLQLGEMRAELDPPRTHIFDLCMAARSMCDSAIRCDAFQVQYESKP